MIPWSTSTWAWALRYTNTYNLRFHLVMVVVCLSLRLFIRAALGKDAVWRFFPHVV
jgi:hypothetical protein